MWQYDQSAVQPPFAVQAALKGHGPCCHLLSTTLFEGKPQALTWSGKNGYGLNVGNIRQRSSGSRDVWRYLPVTVFFIAKDGKTWQLRNSEV